MESKKDPRDFHKCDFCPYGTKLFPTILQHTNQHRRKLQGHVDIFTCHKNISEIHKCENCDFATNLKISLRHHFNQNHRGLKNQKHFINVVRRCGYCDYQTYSVLLQLKHYLQCEEREHSRRNWLECGHCSYKTQNKFYLTEHMKNLHATLLTLLQCEKSSLHPKNERRLRKYVSYIKDKNFRDPKWINCDKCLFRSKWNDSLKRHKSVKHIDSINCFESADCEFESKSKFSLKMHILEQHIYSPSEKRLQCDKCTYTAKCKFLLKRHIRLNHAISENNQSLPYDKITKWKTILQRRLGNENNQSPSLQYENITKWKTTLKRRLENTQTGSANIVWYQCVYCGFQSKSISLLQQHIVSNHTECKKTKSENVVWYPCDKCEYKTKYKRFLEQHRAQIHTNHADFIWYYCDKCSYKAQSHVSLNRHLNCEHTKNVK